MPFKSKAQAKYLYAKKPKIAKKFAEHTTISIKKLPEKISGKKNRNNRRKHKS